MTAYYSQACENNKAPILDVIQPYLSKKGKVLEIGSGTGQHAIYFASKLPHIRWQTSEQDGFLEGLIKNLSENNTPNIIAPIALEVSSYPWGEQLFDAIFSANTLHIMSEEAALIFVSQVAKSLRADGYFMVYGPFNYAGQYTSESNERFDIWLAQQNRQSSIRDFELINEVAEKNGLCLHKDHTMPANNRLLVWQRAA